MFDQYLVELSIAKKLKSLNKDDKNVADNVIIEKEGDIDTHKNDLVIIKNDISNIIINTEHKWGEFFSKHISLAKNILNNSNDN